MDEKDFKKHLKDLVQGHHHPEDHDWPETGVVRLVAEPAKAGKAKAKSRPRKQAKQKK